MNRAGKIRILAAVFLVTIGIAALKTAWASSSININSEGLAIEGYDPIAYFTQGKPLKGSAEFEHTWRGALWRFASAEHRDLFVSAPEKYAPQFGGY